VAIIVVKYGGTSVGAPSDQLSPTTVRTREAATMSSQSCRRWADDR
jgi:aspartokinase